MSIKDILICVEPEEKADVASNYGLSLALMCSAHATATSIVYEIPVGIYGAEVPQEYLERIEEGARESARAAEERFTRLSRLTGVRAETVAFISSDNSTATTIAELARHFDVTIVSQPRDESSYSTEIIERIMFSSGRPVLVVPYIRKEPAQFETVLVAWDGSEVAAKAVAAALPFLEMAKHVQVVSITDIGRSNVDLPGFNITRHLARHGVKAELKTIPNSSRIGDVLLSHAADAEADLLVMGAYGHSRFREFILGGATRTVLQTMTVPVLFAH